MEIRTMKRTKLGTTEVEVCAAPLGAMYLGTKQVGEEAFALLDAYAAAGGDFIDTANIYAHWVGPRWQGGESETQLGEWLRARKNRNKVVIATKVGFNYQDVPQSLSPRLIRHECEKSLKRLGVGTIDLYFAHCDDPEVPQGDVLETFAGLIREGKVRAIGASNFSTHRLATANHIASISNLPRYEVLQQRYTYLQPRQDADTGRQVVLSKDMQDYCVSAGISIMAYSATLGGAYTGKAARSLPPAYQSIPNAARLKTLSSIAGEINATPQQVMLAWLWSRPGMLPMIAVSSEQQLAENLAASEFQLTGDQLKRLGTAGD
jgi:aryl-alcohol dehydrogenase-like predicted oxidoreductase